MQRIRRPGGHLYLALVIDDQQDFDTVRLDLHQRARLLLLQSFLGNPERDDGTTG